MLLRPQTPVRRRLLVAAFTLAVVTYLDRICMPSGWMADVVGPRRVLTRIVVWWSGFTVLTAAAWNYSSFLVIRFLFGAGEAGAFPGRLTDRLSAAFGLRMGRCRLGCAAFSACAALRVASTQAEAVLLALALASADLGLGANATAAAAR